MTEICDSELLSQFATYKSETAFAQLVERHIGLVHAVALRHTGNPEQARDITQAVFILLAKKANSLGSKVLVAGWLYRAAQLTASNFRRAEANRLRCEQEAFMVSGYENQATDTAWRELAPSLDEAMSQLGQQ